MKEFYDIALFVETFSSYGRQILRGFKRYIETHQIEHWTVLFEDRNLNSQVPGWLASWNGDALVSRCQSTLLQRHAHRNGIAFIELCDRRNQNASTTVVSDDEAIGRIAGEHLNECGLSNFAFCGFHDEQWSSLREKGFANYVSQVKNSRYFSTRTHWFLNDMDRREKENETLSKWLKNLPKPIGIMACNDACGKQLVDCCRVASIAIPDEVALIGVDNDELVCSFCLPPLTSAIPNAEAVGFQSAKLVDELLGSPEPSERRNILKIPPIGVFPRQSSDIIAVDDHRLRTALRFIRSNACKGLTVSQIAKEMQISRSTLERLLREGIGRSPQKEIRRVQIRKVCSLLASTQLTIEKVAHRSGFEDPAYMHSVFRKAMHMTPGHYRKQSSG